MQFSLGARPVKDPSNRSYGKSGQTQEPLAGSWPGQRQKPITKGKAKAGNKTQGGSTRHATVGAASQGGGGQGGDGKGGGNGGSGEGKGGSGGPDGAGEASAEEPIPRKIEDALHRFAEILHYPQNSDVVFRKFVIGTKPEARALLIYVEGICDAKRVEKEVLFPLMDLPHERPPLPIKKLGEYIMNVFIPVGTAKRQDAVQKVVGGVMLGEAALILDGGVGILMDIKSPPSRSPEKPEIERSVTGPQMGFVESHRTNTAMLRGFIHDPDLIVEQLTVGMRTKSLVSMFYIEDLANPKLVDEVRRRIGSVSVDQAMDTDSLARLIEDHPVTLVPTTLITERPDRVALHILKGAVAVLVNESAHAMIVPVNFAMFLHTIEDVYLRFPYASFVRILRLSAAGVALLLPGAYIALVNYHQEIIPPLLLLTLAAARESIPFPLIFNLTFMELAFELIREAGLRVPSAIGPTIGIVGALLLGDMAVRSGLVTPAVVIVVAVTALANFAVPDPQAQFAVRLGRFFFIALAGVFGVYGLGIGIFLVAIHMASLKSFGMPYLSPIGPWRAGPPDVILRGPIWAQEKRSVFLRPLNLIREARYSRAWDPGVVGQTQAMTEAEGDRALREGAVKQSQRSAGPDNHGASQKPGGQGDQRGRGRRAKRPQRPSGKQRKDNEGGEQQ